MIQSVSVSWMLMIVSMLCWGSWANTFKLTRNVRFELFYWDYAIGLTLTAMVLTVVAHIVAPGTQSVVAGILGVKTVAILWAGAAGVVFNVANLLLVAGIAVAGLAVAFPVAIGTALIVGTALTFAVDQKGNAIYIFFGVVLAAMAVVCCAAAYRAQAAGMKITRRGVLLCLVSGLLMASWAPLAAASIRRSPGYLTPLTSFAVFAVAVLLSTVPFNLFLMRRPIVGAPISIRDYKSGGMQWHFLGLLGGAIWSIGTASNLLAGSSVGFAISYAIGQSAPLVASLWGVFVWREFAGASSTAKRALTGMFLLYAAAIAVLSRAL